MAAHLACSCFQFHEFKLESQCVTREHRFAELGVVDAHEVDKLPFGIVYRTEKQNSAGLGHRLDDENRRHDRMTGKVAHEEWFVERYVLDAHHAVLRKLGDPVHQKERIAVRHDLHNKVDIYIRCAKCLVSQLESRAVFLLGIFPKEPRQLDVGGVTRFESHNMALDRHPHQEKISDQVENFMSNEFVGETQFLVALDLVPLDHDGVVVASAFDQTHFPQAVDFFLEGERAGGGDLIDKRTVLQMESRVLRPDQGTVELDGEADAKTVIRKDHKLDTVLLERDRTVHTEVEAFRILFLDARFLQEFHVRKRAPIRFGRFLRVQLDIQVVDPHTGHRGENVLHRADPGAVLLKDSSAHAPFRVHRRGNVRDDFYRLLPALPDETDSRVHRSRAKSDCDVFTGVKAHSLNGYFTNNGSLSNPSTHEELSC